MAGSAEEDHALFASSVIRASCDTRTRRHVSQDAQRRYEAALAAYIKPTAALPKPIRTGKLSSTRELLMQVEHLCLRLRAADPCAATGPSEADTAERALVLDAPQQAFELQSSAEMCARSGHRGNTHCKARRIGLAAPKRRSLHEGRRLCGGR